MKMNRTIQTQHSDLNTALSLLGFEASKATRLRNARELARQCRELDMSCAEDGANYPDYQIAANCAAVLEKLATRFRRVEAQLLGAA